MKSKTVLIVASTASMIKQFNQRNIMMLQENGCKVVVATNFNNPGTIPQKDGLEFKKQLEEAGVETVQIDFIRGLKGTFKNISAYRQLNQFVKNSQIDLIHSQTPIGGVVGRIVGHKNSIKNLYVVHGFHFFKGSPIRNWLAYPIEKYLSRYTDYLVTINQEDYDFAKRKFRIKNISNIDSAGVDFDKMDQQVVDDLDALKNKVREQNNWSQDSTVMITVAELSKRKNITRAIQAFAKANQPNLKYLIVGKGPLKDDLISQIKKNNLNDRVSVIGYSNNVFDLLSASDFMIFISLREGLGLAGVEGLHFNLPVIGSDVRGIKDYIQDGQNGFLVNPKNINQISEKIISLNNIETRKKLAAETKKSVENFDSKNIDQLMLTIYTKLIE